MHKRPLALMLALALVVGLVPMNLAMAAPAYEAQEDFAVSLANNGQIQPDIDYPWIVWKDNRFCVDDDEESDIYAYNFATGEEVQVSSHRGPESNPSISGDWVVYSHDPLDGDYCVIYAYNLATGEERLLSQDVGENEGNPAIEGDIVVCNRRGNEDIWMYDLSTETSAPITADPGYQYAPEIGDGWVVYRDLVDSSWSYYNIMAYNLETEETTLVAEGQDASGVLHVSYDGPSTDEGKVVYEEYSNDWIMGYYSIKMYDIATQTETTLSTVNDGTARYHPVIGDGLVTWHDRRVGAYEVYAYDLTSEEEICLVPAVYDIDSSTWIQYAGRTTTADGIVAWHDHREEIGDDALPVNNDGIGDSDDLYAMFVSSAPPTAVDDAYATTKGLALTVDATEGVLANDFDADDDPLSATLADDPANGVVALDADGGFTYTPEAGFTGVDSFTYQVSDGTYWMLATVSITVTNTAPVAVDDAYEAGFGQPLYVGAAGVLTNDIDADGDPLTALKVTGPANGTLALDADGSFVYIPDAGFDGLDTFTYKASDGTAQSDAATVEITVAAAIPPAIEVAGDTRVDTAIAASVLAFPDGADVVVLATAMNWPDALGGGALAGVLDAPVLLTDTNVLPQSVVDEIERLGATKVVIIGGTGAVSANVENAIDNAIIVERIAGDDRYETAEAVAARVIAEQGAGFSGTALAATGADFADALAAAPLAAAQGWPLYLVDPVNGLTAASKTALGGMTQVVILGGEGAVSKPVFDYLEGELGEGAVVRLGGANRYATAVVIATYAVDEAGHMWDGVGIATGENFPDALAGGVLQGKVGSVMLLTSSTDLSAATRAALVANADEIDTVRFYGGIGAISQLVRDAVAGVVK